MPQCACYFDGDWLGGSRFSSTYFNRTMKNDLAYAPFGEQYAAAGAAPLGLGNVSFAGNSEDTATNLYDAQNREYEPFGRWPSPDPAGVAAANPANPQSWNRYAYVMNNPLIATDPSGLGPYIPSAPEPNDPLGDYPGCYMDGIPIGCGQAEMEVGIGAAMVCPDSSCGGVGSPFECDAAGNCGYNLTAQSALKDDLKQLFADNPDCAGLLGGQAAADLLVNKMNMQDTTVAGYTPPSAFDPKIYQQQVVPKMTNGAATFWFPTAGGDAATWNGTTYWTFTNAIFNGWSVSQQETSLIHEMGHVYTNSGSIPDLPTSEYTFQNIANQCDTAIPTKPN